MLGFSPLAASPLASSASIEQGFGADDVFAGAPLVDSPSLTQFHALKAAQITTGAPVVDAPDIDQLHNITASSITTSTPAIDTTTLAEDYGLTERTADHDRQSNRGCACH